MMTFTTPDLSDNFSSQVQVLAPLIGGCGLRNFGGKSRFSGQIVTVKCHEDNSLVKEQVEQAGDNKILVVDGGGSLRCALLGDLLAQKAVDNGWHGLIIYGCIRDVDEIAQMNLGVQALAAIPIKSVRKGRGDLNIPLSFGGVIFTPGDFVYADNNGVLVARSNLI